MSRRKYENVLEHKTFDFKKHYLSIYYKLIKFERDFGIKPYIEFKNNTEINNCVDCHSQIGEPAAHHQAKKKIFKLFLNTPNYLVESELKAMRDLNVPGKGIRNYQFDILVVNAPNWIKFIGHLKDVIRKNGIMDIQMLRQYEQGLIFAVELDGSSHVDRKDAIRDRFFFSTYNIVTVRYDVGQLVNVEETVKQKRMRLRYDPLSLIALHPIFYNITTEQIVNECRNIYTTKYPHL